MARARRSRKNLAAKYFGFNFNDNPLPLIDLASLGLSDADLEIARGILDSDGRLRETCPDADEPRQGPPPEPSVIASTVFVWQLVVAYLSSHEEHLCYFFDFALTAPDNHESLHGLINAVIYSIPRTEHYGVKNVKVFWAELRSERKRFALCGDE